MTTNPVSVVSLHPDPARPLDLDLKHILSALGPFISEWTWCVMSLDWLGDQSSEDLCRAVERAGQAGLWMSAQGLVDSANKVYQTMEGEFLAFPERIDPGTLSSDDLNLRCFPSNRADLAIVAIDGQFFEVYTKNSKWLTSLLDMRGVRREDPSLYF